MRTYIVELLRMYFKGVLFAIGVGSTALVAATVSETFIDGDTLTADKLNSLKDAIESIDESVWGVSGSSISYMDGNVGIGKSSPSNILEVVYNEDDASSFVLVKNSNNGTSARSQLRVANDADSNVQFGIAGTNYNLASGWANKAYVAAGSATSGLMLVTSTSDIEFRVAGTSTVDHIMTAGGDVGIGTDSPASKLSVAGLPTSAPSSTGSTSGYVCADDDGNFYVAASCP